MFNTKGWKNDPGSPAIINEFVRSEQVVSDNGEEGVEFDRSDIVSQVCCMSVCSGCDGGSR